MPPLPISTEIASVESWHALLESHNLLGALLLLSLVATVFRSIAVIIGRRKSRMACVGAGHEGPSIDKGKKLVGKGRRDSSQDEDEQPLKIKEKRPVSGSQTRSDLEKRKDEDAHRSSRDQRPNDYLESLEKETLQPFLLPIYPWTAPPQSLPGPYDAPYFPLPLPTIGAEHPTGTDTQPPTIKTEAMPDTAPEELETIAYSRRVSPNALEPASLLNGTVTVSNKGWRRTQWTVTAG